MNEREHAREREDADTMKLREEQLNVTKQRVQGGEVRLGKEVVEEQQTMDVPVTREEVVIERRPVNAPSDTPITGDSRTIEVPVTQERVNVSKDTVVTEEIGVTKRVTQENQQVSGTARREEARIETAGNVHSHDAGDQQRFHARWEDVLGSFRDEWQSRGGQGRWDEQEPHYRYGYDQFGSGRYSGRSWSQVEPELRTDWESRNPGRSWDSASGQVRHAWEHLSTRAVSGR
jgi:uncharacterized protein (TIGR02271 family)